MPTQQNLTDLERLAQRVETLESLAADHQIRLDCVGTQDVAELAGGVDRLLAGQHRLIAALEVALDWANRNADAVRAVDRAVVAMTHD